MPVASGALPAALVVAIVSTIIFLKWRNHVTAQAALVFWLLTGFLFVLDYVSLAAVIG